MKIDRTVLVRAPVERVWSILADEYAAIGTWARAVSRSAAAPGAPSVGGSPVGGRVCTADIGEVSETITIFDPIDHHLAYRAQAKAMPFFVRSLEGDWRLSSVHAGTQVQLGFVANLMFPFSLIAAVPMKRQFKSAIDETLEDLVLYAETGKVHPDKSSSS